MPGGSLGMGHSAPPTLQRLRTPLSCLVWRLRSLTTAIPTFIYRYMKIQERLAKSHVTRKLYELAVRRIRCAHAVRTMRSRTCVAIIDRRKLQMISIGVEDMATVGRY